MKLLHFNYCSDFYHDLTPFNHPNSLSTAEILELILKKRMITPVTFSESMKLLGWDAQDFLLNDFFLKKWTKENNLEYINFEKTLEQAIDRIRPDIVYVERALHLFDPHFITYLKGKFHFIKAFAAWFGHGVVGNAYKQLNVYDLIFCLSEKFAEQAKPYCPHSYEVPSAFDFLPHERPTPQPKKYLFSFMGTSGHGCPDHRDRYRGLQYLLNRTPLKIWANEPFAFSKKKYHKRRFYKSLYKKRASYLQKMLEGNKQTEIKDLISTLSNYKKEHKKIPGGFFKNLSLEMPLKFSHPKKVFPAVLGADYYEKIQQSHIVFNIHTDWKGLGGNFRVFETAGLGSCLLTDRADSMTNLLEPGKEIVPYTSIEEAVDRFKYLRKNLRLVHEIAQNAQNRIFESHLVYHRCKQIQELIINYLSEAR